MPSNCASKRRGSRKNRKNSRKSRKGRRMNMYGGEAPVNYSNPGPMDINLAQGEQFAKFHAQQHGGALVGGPFPGAVTEGAFNPGGLMASARQDPLIQAYAEIKQYGPSSDNPNLRGGKRRRRGSRKSRKTRKGSRKAQRGGDFIRWGGARKSHRKSHKGRRGSRKYRGGAFSGGLNNPMPVGDEGKMLIPESLQQQAGMSPEWALAKDPMSFAPIAK